MRKLPLFLVLSLMMLFTACQQQEKVDTQIEIQDKTDKASALLTPQDQLSTLTIEENEGFSFLYPVTYTYHPHTELETEVNVHIKFFKYDANDNLKNTPLSSINLSTEAGTIHPYTYYYYGEYYSFYYADWNTHLYDLDNGDKVRLEVRLDNAEENAPACNDGTNITKGCVGFLDIQVWNSYWDVIHNNCVDDGILDVRNGWWLPIQFHIEEGSIDTDIIDTPTDAPQINITAPVLDNFLDNEEIYFAATANDKQDGDISDNIAWSSNLDGALGTGPELLTTLTTGNHTITASITDSDNKTRQATYNLEITNSTTLPPLPDGWDGITIPADIDNPDDGFGSIIPINVDDTVDLDEDFFNLLGNLGTDALSVNQLGLHTTATDDTSAAGKPFAFFINARNAEQFFRKEYANDNVEVKACYYYTNTLTNDVNFTLGVAQEVVPIEGLKVPWAKATADGKSLAQA